MKTHFEPYATTEPDEPIEKYPCGTIAPSDYATTTHVWASVDCLRCLKNKERLQKSFEETEKAIVCQMGDMANFFEKENIN